MAMKYLISCQLLFVIIYSHAQNLDPQKKYYIACVAFWNVENLYDTLNDQWKNDEWSSQYFFTREVIICQLSLLTASQEVSCEDL